MNTLYFFFIVESFLYYGFKSRTEKNDKKLTINKELSIPPAKDMFFQVMVITCFGKKVSEPITPSRMSHVMRSRISTPSWSVRVYRREGREHLSNKYIVVDF